MKLPSKWPHIVKRGSVIVKIYRTERGKYREFRVRHTKPDGKRAERSFADFSKALRYANTVAVGLSKGDAAPLTLTGDEVAVYRRAVDSLSQLGISLDAAASDYAHAKSRLGEHSLSAAADFFVRNHAGLKCHRADENQPCVGGRPRTAKHIKDLKGRLASSPISPRRRSVTWARTTLGSSCAA